MVSYFFQFFLKYHGLYFQYIYIIRINQDQKFNQMLRLANRNCIKEIITLAIYSSYNQTQAFHFSTFPKNRFINIRKQAKIKKLELMTKDKEAATTDQLTQSPEFSKFNRNEWSNNSKSKQFHSLNVLIKNSEKISQLFYIFHKNHKVMTIEQHLAILERFVFLDNIKYDPTSYQIYQSKDTQIEPLASSFFEKFQGKILDKFQLILFRKGYKDIKTNKIMNNTEELNCSTNENIDSLAPEYYIGFINIISKSKNIQLLHYTYHKFIIKLLAQQFILNNTQAQNSQRQSIQSISEVLTLDDNIRLIKSLFRFLNNRDLKQLAQANDYNSDHREMLVKFIGSIGKYIHIPFTSPQISTGVLMELINLYLKGYPTIKISKSMLKSIIKQALRRIKTQPSILNLIKDNKNRKVAQKQVQQKVTTSYRSPVMLLKNLLLLQKLLYTYLKQSTLVSQILLTKQNNLVHNQFFAIQQKIHKILKQLVISLSNRNSHSNLNEYIDILHMLGSHIDYLYIQIPIEVIAKCDMLTEINQQMELIILFLKHIQEQLGITGSTPINFRDKNNERIFLQFSKILAKITLCQKIRNRLPQFISQSYIQNKILGGLILKFSSQPKDIQIILIAYLSHSNMEDKSINKSQESLKQMIRIFIQAQTYNQNGYLMKNNKQFSDALYFFILLGNKNYLQLIQQIEMKHGLLVTQNSIKLFKQTFKSLINNLHSQEFWIYFSKFIDINSFSDAQKDYYQIKYQNKYMHNISQILFIYLDSVKIGEEKKKKIDLIIQCYKKASIKNRSFSIQKIQMLSCHHSQLTNLNIVSQSITNLIDIQTKPTQNNKVPKYREKKSFQDAKQNTKQLKKGQVFNLIKQRLDKMLSRISFMIILSQKIKIYKDQSQRVDNCINKIKEIYNEQSQLLRFPGAYQHHHIESLYYIDRYLASLKGNSPINQSHVEQTAQNTAQQQSNQPGLQYRYGKKGQVYLQYCRILKQYEQKYLKVSILQNLQKLDKKTHKLNRQLVLQKIERRHRQLSQLKCKQFQTSDVQLLDLRIKSAVDLNSLEDVQLAAIGTYGSQNREMYNVGYIIEKRQTISEISKEIVGLLKHKYYSQKYKIDQIIYVQIY